MAMGFEGRGVWVVDLWWVVDLGFGFGLWACRFGFWVTVMGLPI